MRAFFNNHSWLSPSKGHIISSPSYSWGTSAVLLHSLCILDFNHIHLASSRSTEITSHCWYHSHKRFIWHFHWGHTDIHRGAQKRGVDISLYLVQSLATSVKFLKILWWSEGFCIFYSQEIAVDPLWTHDVKTSPVSFSLLGLCRQHILYLQILCKLLQLAHLQLGSLTTEGSKSVQIVLTTVIPLAPPLPISRESFTVEALAASSSHIPPEISGSPMMILCCP